jgi:M6 family metalloprotease-like protein
MKGTRGENQRYSNVFFLTCFILTFFFSIATALALQPANHDEMRTLEESGQLEKSLEKALKIGNHKIKPQLVQKFKLNATKLFLKSKGLSTMEVDRLAATLPPAREGGLPSTGSPKIFALLIEFQDETQVNSATDINNMLFGEGDAEKFPRESLASYYDRSSYGLLDLSGGTTLGWYKTSYDRSGVTQTGAGRENLIKEALNHFDANGHDFSQYDNDNDGDIEYFIVLWAGPNGAWATFWWAWNLGWNDSTYTIDGKTLSNYSWQRESDNPTVVIHETGHSLGLPDLYDYDNTVGPGSGVGGFDPMDSNLSDMNCFWKWMLGWLTPRVVFGGTENISLNDTTTSEDCVLIWPGVSLNDIFGEFYMIQNRQSVGNDSNLWFTPDGLAVWHVDATLDAAGTNFEYNNSTTDHKLLRLMEADGLEEIEGFDCCTGCSCQVADSGDLYSEGDEFGPETMPSSDKYDGTDSCVRLWNIVDEGTTAGDLIVADYSTICNNPPVSDANGPYFVECQGANSTVNLDGSGSYDKDDDTITYFWSTNCPGATFSDLTLSNPILSVYTFGSCLLTCEVSLTVTDTKGDTDTDKANLTVKDETQPVLSTPTDVTIECDQSTDPSSITGKATASDNCDPAPVVSYSDVETPGECPGEKTISRTWTATDACGNTTSQTQTINVVDTTEPDISFNAPATIVPPDAAVSFTATAKDNCDSAPSVSITGYDCFAFTKKGKRVDKKKSCVVSIKNDTITILDSGGVDTHIEWTGFSTDSCGNVAEEDFETVVVNPVQ